MENLLNGKDTVDKEFRTNLIGLARIRMEHPDMAPKLAYTAIFIMLVVYTFLFTFVYLKRLLYMAFLTLIAPVVTVTYPIDKMNDGSAQAFNMWLKEYVFNALLQPFHLILYIVLVGTAMDLAANNIIYAIVAMAFIHKAEDMLRKFFQFEQAQTTSGIGAFAGGALTAQAFSKIKSLGGGSKSSASAGAEAEARTRFSQNNTGRGGIEAFAGGALGGAGTSGDSSATAGSSSGGSVTTPNIPGGSSGSAGAETNSTGLGGAGRLAAVGAAAAGVSCRC